MNRSIVLLFLPLLFLAACGKSRQRGNATIQLTIEADTAQLRRQWGERPERFSEYRDRLLKESQDIIASRLKEYGFSEDDVELKQNAGMIHITLKHTTTDENENSRLKRMVTAGGNLDIWEVYSNMDAFPVLNAINHQLDSTASAAAPKNEDTAAGEGSLIAEAKVRRQMEAEQKAHTNMLFSRLTPNIQVDQKTFRVENESPIIARAAIKDTAEIGRYFRRQDISPLIPHNMIFAWYDDGNNSGVPPGTLALLALKGGAMNRPAMQAVEVLQAGTEKGDGGWLQISLEMKPGYSETWQRLTKANTGKGLAMAFSGRVMCCPTVSGEIAGGKMQITGNFTNEEAKDMALMLKASAMPVSFRIVESHVQ